MKKDKGWQFLFSDDFDDLCENSNEDYCSKNSDGSASYYSEDGSWGSRSSDGSGSYYGADGSWGSRSSDGSGSYYGADGSWGSRSPDGSSSYYGSDGSYESCCSDDVGSGHDSDEDKESKDSSWGDIIAGVLTVGVESVRVLNAKAAAEERLLEVRKEAERHEAQQRRKQEKEAWRYKHRKSLSVLKTVACIAVLVSLLAGIGMFIYYEYRLLSPIGFSTDDVRGMKYSEAVQYLKDAGFGNIRTKVVADLPVSEEDEAFVITDARLLFGNQFSDDMLYPVNLWITLEYHTVELFRAPLTMDETKGMDYKAVSAEFKSKGFTDVKLNPKYDIITGWINNDGEVASVTINGREYDRYDQFRLDADVVITYHTLRKNKP